MTDLCFNNVKSVVDEIAKDTNIMNYHINVTEDKFTGNNYSSKIVRAQIVEDEGKKRQINLLIKLLTLSQNIRNQFEERSSLKISEVECLAYKTVLPTLHKFQSDHKIPDDKCFTYPKFYKGGAEYLREFMILGDASYDGFEMYNKVKPLDYDHARVVLTNLARYHAVSFAMADKDPKKFEQLHKPLFQEHLFTDTLEKLVINLGNSVFPQIKNKDKANVISEFLKGCGVKVKKCYDSTSTAPYNVICHGDFHLNNMMFKYENKTPEILFVDWQIIRLASPVTDIMQFIFMPTDKEFRDKYYKQVCDDYYNALGENLGLYGCDVNKIYPREVFDQNLIDLLPIGVVFGVLGCMVMLQNPGEEKDLDQLLGDNMTGTMKASDEMLRRIEGCADDIIHYEEILKRRNCINTN